MDKELYTSAIKARLHYELICIHKYDQPNRPSKPPKKGDRMCDIAFKYNTCCKEMKTNSVMIIVEDQLEKNKNKWNAAYPELEKGKVIVDVWNPTIGPYWLTELNRE